MRQTSEAKLFDRNTQTYVSAELIIGVTTDEVDEAVAIWSPYRRERETQTGRRSQHAHWDWSRKARAISAAPNYVIAGLTIDDEMQALLLWEDEFVTGRHPDQLGRPLVYVHFVSSAPWNDRDIVEAPKYKGSGTLLIRAAVERSIELGYKGRLGLHALPQAESFYRDRCKMADLDVDTTGPHKGLRCFEFTSELSDKFIKELA
jgi:hypothetical protein